MPDHVVHIVDDDEAVRESLSFLLTAAGYKAETYASGEEFVAVLGSLGRGCLITDVRMPRMSGIELLGHVRDNGNPLPVIVITGHGDVPLAVEAMKLGATEFLEKPFNEVSLLAAVKTACERTDRQAAESSTRVEVRGRYDSLSRREREVLQGLIAGHQNKSIAHDLGISPRTVEVYRAKVMGKMQAGSLSELVRMCLTAELEHP